MEEGMGEGGKGRKRQATTPLSKFLYLLLRTIHQENNSWLVNSILDIRTLVNKPTNR